MIKIKEIIDYKSSQTDSDGGTITATEIVATQTRMASNATDTTLHVIDAHNFSVGDAIVIFDGTNLTEDTVVSTYTAGDPNRITVNFPVGYAFPTWTMVAKKQNLLVNIDCSYVKDGTTIYRKFFRKNTNPTYTWGGVVNFIENQPSYAAISIAIGTAIDTDGTSAGLQWYGKRVVAGAVVNAENGDIATFATGLLTGDLIPNASIPIWVRYMPIPNSIAVRVSTVTISSSGVTSLAP